MDLDGLIVQSTVESVNVNSVDTLGELLLRLQEEQEGLDAHDQLINRLNDDNSNDGDVIVETIRRQIFNWLFGSLTTKEKSLQKVQIVSQADVELL